MSINRRQILVAGTVCGAVGVVLGRPEVVPVYFNFFHAPVRTDRYLRNMQDLVASRPVDQPSLNGNRSLEMEFRFSEKRHFGQLLWDLTPRRVQRIRFHVFNPNAASLGIQMNVSLIDTERRTWTLNMDGRPLSAKRWTKVDAKVSKYFSVRKGKEQFDAADFSDVSFARMLFRFEVAPDFPDFGEPIQLYLDGLELF